MYDWSKDKRSQLVYVSGTVEELDGVRLYEIFSPAKVLDDAGIEPGFAGALGDRPGDERIECLPL